MRLSKMRERRVIKEEGRHMSMTGWDKLTGSYDKKKLIGSRNAQRNISMGIGHHLARMMKGHI